MRTLAALLILVAIAARRRSRAFSCGASRHTCVPWLDKPWLPSPACWAFDPFKSCQERRSQEAWTPTS